MIAIVDYGLGNVKAFSNIYRNLGIPWRIVTSEKDLGGATRIILPGVGAFDSAVERLKCSGLLEPLEKLVLQGRIPLLGVCVGMQILASSSEEGQLPGLGWVGGAVKKFAKGDNMFSGQLPHMGWNNVSARKRDGLFCGIDDEARFYFLHSYFFHCDDDEDVLAEAEYGIRYACAVNRGNIYGVQFHPEKSHGSGVQLLRNFWKLPDAAA